MRYSFIIPAHNAEKTIRKTVQSITERVSDFEILIIENGSEDGTNAVMDSFSVDNRIRCFHSEKGVSRARNMGIENAAGEWIIFVDADDCWEANTELLDEITSKYSSSDFIICGYYKDSTKVVHDYELPDQEVSGDALLSMFSWCICKPTLRTEVWAKLFKRDFLHSKKIRFDEELTHSEDAEFMISCFESCRTASVTTQPVYRFSSGSPSTMRTFDDRKRTAYLKALRKIDRHAIVHDQRVKTGYRDFIVSHVNLIAVHEIYSNERTEKWSVRNSEMKSLLDVPLIKNAVSQLNINDCRDVYLLPGYLFGNKMYTLGGLICRIRSIQNSRRYKRFGMEK